MRHKVSRLKPFGALVEATVRNVNVKDVDVEALRDLFREEQLVVLRDFKGFESSKSFSDYCESWGEISLWPFGKVLELKEQDSPEDHIFDSSYVPLHWDGMYRPQIPEYQIFHCAKAPLPGQGGRTTFSNTLLALQNASSQAKEFWGQATGVYQREMKFYNSKTFSPVIALHPYKDISVIRYNEPPSPAKGRFINPPKQEFHGVCASDLESFHCELQKALYSPASFYAHEWKDGDVVIADNFSLLHGREAFVSKSPRHIQRVQVLSDPPYDNPGLESFR